MSDDFTFMQDNASPQLYQKLAENGRNQYFEILIQFPLRVYGYMLKIKIRAPDNNPRYAEQLT